VNNPLAEYTVTQTWAQHIRNAGPNLGGVDYAMPVGTPLPILQGTFEWVTPRTLRKPAWYNTGLGNAAAYRRADGTRTVFGHCSGHSGREAFSGNTGHSSGPHVHAHDVLADGVTRARPFTTIPEEDDLMGVLITAAKQLGKPTFFVAPGHLHRVTPAELGPFRTQTKLTRVELSDADFLGTIGPFGFERLTMSQVVAIPPGATYRPPASVTPTAFEFTGIATPK
jgi:hypothetical protein